MNLMKNRKDSHQSACSLPRPALISSQWEDQHESTSLDDHDQELDVLGGRGMDEEMQGAEI
jgi:hypothetical protein